MLASANQCEIDQTLIAGLEVVLPEGLRAFFCEAGYMATTAEEYRTNARLRVRSVADMLLVNSPSALRNGLAGRESRAGKVLIKDLSRSGIAILYHQQIYPQERFQIRFQGRLILSIAVRCRRLGSMCYEIGGKVVSVETSEEPAT